MNRNTIIGLVLIFGIFIAYSYFMSPSDEEKALQKQKSDSLALVMKDRRDSITRANAKQEVLEELRQAQEMEAQGEVIDDASLTQMELRDQLGLFANSAVGEDKYFTIESDLLKLHISTKGGRIENVELKEYKTWEKNPTILLNSDSLHFGFSFFSGNRLINTDRLYFQPFWSDIEFEGKDLMVVTGSDSHQFSMRLYPDAGENGFNRHNYIEYLFTIHGDKYMIGYQLNFVEMEM